MPNDELLKTIEQLKSCLYAIDSARQQVSTTVAAYDGTQKKIESYTNSLMNINNTITGVISILENNKVLIEQQATKAIDKLDKSCNDIVNDFKSASNDSINHLENAIKEASAFSDEIRTTSDRVNDIAKSIDSLHQKLKTSQDEQDKAISENLSISKQSHSTLSNQDQTLKGQNKILQNIDSISNAIDSTVKGLNTLCVNIQSSIDTLAKTLNTARKEVKYNRIINVAILVILVIGVVLMFVLR